jgi:4-alpha-glucanotransferase
VAAAIHRSAGIVIPLFSLRGDRGWGIGELPDIGAVAGWLASARLKVLSMLPLLEVALGQDSPYGALSAFAIDPAYVALEKVEDFVELGGEQALSPNERAELERLRASPRVDYGPVRRLKQRWLRRSFERFVASGAANSSARSRELAAFRDEHTDWLPDYALFRALKDAEPNSWWQAWPEQLKVRERAAMAAARARHSLGCAFFEYLQWQAFRQLAAARREANARGVALAGDLPFMVAEDSADAWARQQEFRFDASVGVPPDAYSENGQDWGLPVYRWEVIAPGGYQWLKRRGERTAQGFELVRVDHVVGFYRTYVRPKGQGKDAAFFSPAEEPAQVEQGEAVMLALRRGGTALIAEDLGTVPDFVRQSLTRLGIPGFRVLRWEKEGAVFRDPQKWPAISVGTTGTHDTEPIAVWWEALPKEERDAIRKLPRLGPIPDAEAAKFTPAVHQALLETVYGSGSTLLLLPVQDIFGARERINLPGTVSAENWSYRLPWTVSQLSTEAVPRERARVMAELGQRFER